MFALARRRGSSSAPPACTPAAAWQEQRIIDTPHYRRVEEELGYIAWTNNTFALHLHVGVRGADRAVAVSTAMRRCCPSCSRSPPTRVPQGATRACTPRASRCSRKSFPRCGIPDAYGDWDGTRDSSIPVGTGSIVETTQIWWSVRPHH